MHCQDVLGRHRAGRSADRIFRAARRGWRREIRLRLAFVVVTLGLFALPVWLFTPYGGFGAGVVLGAVVSLAAWVWDQPPPFVENWRLGRDGERRTEKELRRLRSEGWFARHDLGSEYGNLDHLVVGPGGVFLLDSKNLWGTFAIEGGVLTCHHENLPQSDYPMRKLPRASEAAAHALGKRLRDELGWTVAVRPIVVLWAPFPDQEVRIGRVTIIHGTKLVDWLRAQPIRICEEDRRTIRKVLRVLPAAT
jgi:hypothetical protein